MLIRVDRWKRNLEGSELYRWYAFWGRKFHHHFRFTFIIYWIRLVKIGWTVGPWGNLSRFKREVCLVTSWKCQLYEHGMLSNTWSGTSKYWLQYHTKIRWTNGCVFSECKICKEIVVSFWQRNCWKGSSYYRVLHRKWIDHSQNHHNLSWLMHLVFGGSIFCHSNPWCYL